MRWQLRRPAEAPDPQPPAEAIGWCPSSPQDDAEEGLLPT